MCEKKESRRFSLAQAHATEIRGLTCTLDKEPKGGLIVPNDFYFDLYLVAGEFKGVEQEVHAELFTNLGYEKAIIRFSGEGASTNIELSADAKRTTGRYRINLDRTDLGMLFSFQAGDVYQSASLTCERNVPNI